MPRGQLQPRTGRAPFKQRTHSLHLDPTEATYLLQTMTFSKQKFRSKFGVDYPLYGPFGTFEFDLRFELSPPMSRNYIQMFTQAYDRARAICRVLFPDPTHMHILISTTSEQEAPPCMRLRRFRENSLHRERFQFIGSTAHEGGEWHDPYFEHWSTYAPQSDPEIDTCLWLALSQDIGIEPRGNARIYFVNTDQGFYLHPYDDRGMDLVSVNRSISQSIFNRFNDWLLDYDRERMNAVFAS